MGLGNVGPKYIKTRHNVGFMFVEAFPKLPNTLLLKPDTMMNGSGAFVKKILNYYRLEKDDLYVVHDDLDLTLGEFKIQKAKGPKGHKGIISIEEALGTEDFWRVRIGVDNRAPETPMAGEDYVLDEFSNEELSVVKSAISSAATLLQSKL